jgi:protocatechuate 3,4-dioxygenase beta subunit
MLIRGRVADEGGRPVAGAAIYVSASPGPMPDIAQLTGDDGVFTLAAPAPGRYVIGARAGNAMGEVTVEVVDTDVLVRIVTAE